MLARGFHIRRINQAYFAFNNLYAGEPGSPAATNPIGPKVDELRKKEPTAQRLRETIRDLQAWKT